MGDMADYALDQTMDAEDDRFLYRIGGMSDEKAYDLGIIDEHGGYNHPPMFQREANTKTCKYCGAVGLYWRCTKHGWRLSDKDGNIHTCAKYKP